MKQILILIALCAVTLLSACNNKPKTKYEIRAEEMDGKTDLQLIGATYGIPQNYKVIKATTSQFHEDNPNALRIKLGGVVQVTFSNGEIYLPEFGSLNGSYESGYYATSDSKIWVKFSSADGLSGVIVNNGTRRDPVSKSDYLELTYNYLETKFGRTYKINTVYKLKRLE